MTRTAPRLHAESGFSLVELAVVVLIIGILLTMGLGAMNAVRENTALSATNAKQAAIKEALIGYLRRNSRLPCPDTNFGPPDGIENRSTAGDPATPCISPVLTNGVFGIVPYVTLGLARDAALDGWGNFFSYHVSTATTTLTNTDWTLTANFRTGNTGLLTVNDRNGATVTAIASNVVAVVVSHGPNAFGAYTISGSRNAMPTGADQLENTNSLLNGAPNPNLVYFRRNPTTDDAVTGGAFDDVVLFLTADDLLNPLFRDGSLKTPAAQISETRDALQKIKLALIGYAMSTTPPTGGGQQISPNYGGNSSCSTSGGTPLCRLLPMADSGTNGWQNGTTYSGSLPYFDLGLTLAEGSDPWGTRYIYVINTPAVANNGNGNGISSNRPTGSATAVTITSYGPDTVAGTDDISLAISVSEIRAYLTGLIP